MNEVEFTKGDLTSSGVHIIGADGFKISQVLGVFTTSKEDEANALLFSKANKMYEKLEYLNGLLLSLDAEAWGTTDLGAESSEIEELLAQVRGE